MSRPDPKITALLEAHRAGEGSALERLLPIVYEELRSLASAVFRSQRPGNTLQPTALAHEAWMKLAGGLGPVSDRHHFFAVAAKAMRQILTDRARTLASQRRRQAGGQVSLHATDGGELEADFDLIALEDSLCRLAELNQRHAQVVELRFLGGLTIAETAEVMGLAPSTVEADWAMARSWLAVELRPS